LGAAHVGDDRSSAGVKKLELELAVARVPAERHVWRGRRRRVEPRAVSGDLFGIVSSCAVPFNIARAVLGLPRRVRVVCWAF
jgi:hypothetical protein